jgi:hypothetical protein
MLRRSIRSLLVGVVVSTLWCALAIGSAVVLSSVHSERFVAIAAWFPLMVAIPALVLSGAATAYVAREAWLPLSALAGMLCAASLLVATSAPWLSWYWVWVVFLGVILSLLGGLVGRFAARHALR